MKNIARSLGVCGIALGLGSLPAIAEDFTKTISCPQNLEDHVRSFGGPMLPPCLSSDGEIHFTNGDRGFNYVLDGDEGKKRVGFVAAPVMSYDK